jgi:Carboxypeptidase regulatory-like domain
MKSHRRILSFLALFLLSAFVISSDLSAQSRTTSAVRGVVKTQSGTPVAEATVTIRHLETGLTRTTSTNQSGRFLLSLLQPGGPYDLTVSFLGLADASRKGLMLQVGERQALTLIMDEEALEVEGVTVAVERTEIFNPSQVGVATRLDREQLEALPLISRDLMDLAILSPMVKQTESGGFSVVGQNDRYNAILVDGVSNKDAFGLTSGGVPGGQAGARIIPFDAVAQYEVLVAPFDVRLSGFTGGVLNAVTRTGTNEWRTRASVILRNETLIGDLNLPTGPVAASGVNRSLYTFSVGGPIKLNQAHFFVTGEFERKSQPPTGFNLLRDDPALVRISPERLDEFTSILNQNFGVDGGQVGPFDLDTQLANVFGRVDWNFGNGDRLTIRNVFANAQTDETPNRTQFEAYGLGSNGVFRKSLNNTTSLQLFTDFGATGGNELTLTVQRTEDQSQPVSNTPQIGIDLISDVGSGVFQREVRAGGELFSQENDLKQTTMRMTNSLTLVSDSTTYTVGITGAYYDIQHTFLPGSGGDFFFQSIQDFENNAPQRYQRAVLLPGQSSTADFSVVEAGAFIQTEVDAIEGVTLRFGLRVDVPTVIGSPERNEEVLDLFGVDTSVLPSGQVMMSPRLGFNVLSGGERRRQIRGGFGLFTGQIPFVWLSNAFQNNGLVSSLQLCRGRSTDDPRRGNIAPPYTSGALPESCWVNPENGRSQAPTDLRSVVSFSPDFKYPQELRFSIAWDEQLTDNTTMSLGGVFTHAIRQVVIKDLNLGKPCGNPGSLAGYGGLDRRIFGCPSVNGFEPTREYPQFQQVLQATNESRDLAFTVTSELRGKLFNRMRYQAGYSYGRSFDRMSLSFTDMISNYGFNPTSKDPNEAAIRNSNFDRPHKVIISLFGAPFPGLPNTTISLLYNGQSGAPFSYVYRGDLNGDGFPGLGGAFDRNNDLLYVPESAAELPAGIGTQSLLQNALRNDACLRKFSGQFLKRNTCRAPWQSRLDVRMSHTVTMGGAEVRFEGDVINLLNLLNRRWGNIQTVVPNVALLELGPRQVSFSGQPEPTLPARWAGSVLPNRDEDGRLRPTDPWSILSPDSQWQAQFGIRVTMGDGR